MQLQSFWTRSNRSVVVFGNFARPTILGYHNSIYGVFKRRHAKFKYLLTIFLKKWYFTFCKSAVCFLFFESAEFASQINLFFCLEDVGYNNAIKDLDFETLTRIQAIFFTFLIWAIKKSLLLLQIMKIKIWFEGYWPKSYLSFFIYPSLSTWP